jgi:hypothetical protein
MVRQVRSTFSCGKSVFFGLGPPADIVDDLALHYATEAKSQKLPSAIPASFRSLG